MLKLRYYCQNAGKEEIRKILTEINKKHGTPSEISYLSRNGVYDPEKEKLVYERDFKPNAKVLKKRTGESITRLRSRKGRNYFISLPGTIAIIRNEEVEWYTLGDDEIKKILNAILDKGSILLEKYCK